MNGRVMLQTLLLLPIMVSGVYGRQNALVLANRNGEQQGHQSASGQVPYDPLKVLSHFLITIYPELGEHEAMFDIRIPFWHSFQSTFSFEYHPCRWSAGVSAQPSPVPSCGVPQKELYLAGYVMLGPNQHHPILTFNASGMFIDSRLQAIREQFRGRVMTEYDLRDRKRYWMKEEAMKALRERNPKYGPDHKKEFLASLPIDGLQDVTGCRLRPESAEFLVGRSKTEPPKLEWTVWGDEEPEGQDDQKCWASFEPFDGRLTAMAY